MRGKKRRLRDEKPVDHFATDTDGWEIRVYGLRDRKWTCRVIMMKGLPALFFRDMMNRTFENMLDKITTDRSKS